MCHCQPNPRVAAALVSLSPPPTTQPDPCGFDGGGWGGRRPHHPPSWWVWRVPPQPPRWLVDPHSGRPIPPSPLPRALPVRRMGPGAQCGSRCSSWPCSAPRCCCAPGPPGASPTPPPPTPQAPPAALTSGGGLFGPSPLPPPSSIPSLSGLSLDPALDGGLLGPRPFGGGGLWPGFGWPAGNRY